MCTYESLFNIVSNIASTVISAKSSHDQKVAADYQTKLMMEEAKNVESNAKYELQEGIEESRRKKLQSILNMGEQKSTLAAGNISLSSQTALNVVDDAKLNGELDALNTLKDSEHRAQNYFKQADKIYANAGLNSFRNKRYSANRQALIWTNAIGQSDKEIFEGIDWYKSKVKKNETNVK